MLFILFIFLYFLYLKAFILILILYIYYVHSFTITLNFITHSRQYQSVWCGLILQYCWSLFSFTLCYLDVMISCCFCLGLRPRSDVHNWEREICSSNSCCWSTCHSGLSWRDSFPSRTSETHTVASVAREKHWKCWCHVQPHSWQVRLLMAFVGVFKLLLKLNITYMYFYILFIVCENCLSHQVSSV